MKNTFYLLFVILSVFLFASCGTITGKFSKVALVDCPRNLEAYADGERIEINNELTISKLNPGMNGDTYVDYYSPAIKLNKQKRVTLQLTSGNNNGIIEMKPHFSGAYFLSNLFLTGTFGTILDIATNNHRIHRRFIDVPAILANKPIREWRSKSKLKRAIKRSAR